MNKALAQLVEIYAGTGAAADSPANYLRDVERFVRNGEALSVWSVDFISVLMRKVKFL